MINTLHTTFQFILTAALFNALFEKGDYLAHTETTGPYMELIYLPALQAAIDYFSVVDAKV